MPAEEDVVALVVRRYYLPSCNFGGGVGRVI